MADLSNTTDAQVRGLRGCVFVCGYASCGPACIIQRRVVLPHMSTVGMIAFDLLAERTSPLNCF